MNEEDEREQLIDQLTKILDKPTDHRFRPVVMLQLVLKLAARVQELEERIDTLERQVADHDRAVAPVRLIGGTAHMQTSLAPINDMERKVVGWAATEDWESLH